MYRAAIAYKPHSKPFDEAKSGTEWNSASLYIECFEIFLADSNLHSIRRHCAVEECGDILAAFFSRIHCAKRPLLTQAMMILNGVAQRCRASPIRKAAPSDRTEPPARCSARQTSASRFRAVPANDSTSALRSVLDPALRPNWQVPCGSPRRSTPRRPARPCPSQAISSQAPADQD